MSDPQATQGAASAPLAWTHALRPPTFPDEEKTRAARILHALLVVSIATDVLSEILTLAVSVSNGLIGLPLYGFAVFTALLGLIALQRGHVRAVGVLYIGSSFLLINGAAFAFGGLQRHVALMNIVLVAMSGLVFGARGAWGGAIAAVTAVLALRIGQQQGWVLDLQPDTSPLVTHLLAIGLTAGLMWIADRTLRDALRRVQEARDAAEAHAAALQHTSDTLDDVLRSMADALVITDPTGSIRRTNPALDQLTGRRDLVGRHLHDLFRKPPVAGEVTLQNADDEPIDVAVTRGALADRAGAGHVWVIRDIRHRKEAERRLREAADAADAANRAKSQFLANMSHELRTPLNAVIGYAEMLREDATDEQVLGDLEKIEGAGRHLLALINDILDLSKIEAGKMELHLEEFAIEAACRHATDLVSPMLARGGNRLVLDIAPGIGTMHSDVVRVRQVLFNLLSNAAKFTQDGEVHLSARRDGAYVVYVVRDTGIGIRPEALRRLFQPFTQADASTTRKYGGTGLGLALIRSFVGLLGGSVDVASTVGEGTTFTVRVPAVLGSRRSVTLAPTDLASARGALVLAIDDDPTVHEMLTRTLEKRGMTVICATNGAEGLALAKQHRPRAITLDVMMPGMDGWEVLAKLKGDEQTRDIPVAVLSIVDGQARGHDVGAAAWMLKPIDRRRLVDVIERLVGVPEEVLVVDDDPPLRELAVRVLTQRGCRVREARNGREALAQIRQRRPNLVLLDLMMPEMDGFQLIEALRADEDLRDLPVVVLTAADLDDQGRGRIGDGTPIVAKGKDPAEQILAAVGSTPTPAPARDLGVRSERGDAG